MLLQRACMQFGDAAQSWSLCCAVGSHTRVLGGKLKESAQFAGYGMPFIDASADVVNVHHCNGIGVMQESPAHRGYQ
jgi:hypothetical protein